MVLHAQKKKFTINNYYLINLENKKTGRSDDNCLGKLRAVNNDRDLYILYDNGESYDSKQLKVDLSNLRKEHGVFMFSYEMCNIGNIRKMKVLMPQIATKRLYNNEDEEQELYDYSLEEVQPVN